MTTRFTQDILPKFRSGDIGCMAPKGIRIGDAQWMCDPSASNGFADHRNARRVYAALARGFMPPNQKWPQDWLDAYQSWMTDGFNP